MSNPNLYLGQKIFDEIMAGNNKLRAKVNLKAALAYGWHPYGPWQLEYREPEPTDRYRYPPTDDIREYQNLPDFTRDEQLMAKMPLEFGHWRSCTEEGDFATEYRGTRLARRSDCKGFVQVVYMIYPHREKEEALARAVAWFVSVGGRHE